MFFARKVLACFPSLLFLILIGVLRISPVVAQSCLPDGDVNQDGQITPADALLAFRHFLRPAAPLLDACQQGRANVVDSTSSSITPADALCIFRRFLHTSCVEAISPSEVRLIQVSGNNQSGQPGDILPEPLVVRIENQFGRPVAGVEVTAEIIQGEAEFVPPPSPTQIRSARALLSQANDNTTATALTDAQGEARFFLQLGLTDDLVVTRVTAFDQAVEFLTISGFESPDAIAIEADGSIVVADSFVGAVIRVDPVSGKQSVVSACPLLDRGTFLSIVVEASGTLLTLYIHGPIVRVNPRSGDCSLISGRVFISERDRGSGPPFQGTVGMALEANGSIVVVDAGLDAVIRVDPVSGNRSIISARTRGVGPNFISPGHIVVEPNGQLVVSDLRLGALVRVDPASGNRTILAGCMDIECSAIRGESAEGCGGSLGSSSMAVEADGSLAVGAWVRVDAVTGDRTLISDSCSQRGSGPSVSESGIAIEANGSLVGIDHHREAIFRIDPLTGDRTILSQ